MARETQPDGWGINDNLLYVGMECVGWWGGGQVPPSLSSRNNQKCEGVGKQKRKGPNSAVAYLLCMQMIQSLGEIIVPNSRDPVTVNVDYIELD